MKKKLTIIFAGVLLFAGLCVFLYPAISNAWNTSRQSKLIESHETILNGMAAEDFEREWEKAESYNAGIWENNIYTDVFEAQSDTPENAEYWQVLNMDNNGIMGYLSIPAINVKMPIYHGTAEGVLQIGAGHLSETGLPIGGEGNHSVLVAHRGLPSAKLFTDIDQLSEGDSFSIHILGETLVYEVDQILPMVDKDDMETISEALAITEGEDYVTLFTCTPYGVNTHRLLVRGRRIPYTVTEDSGLPSEAEPAKDYGKMFLIIGIAVAAVAVLILCRIIHLRGRLKQEGKQ